MNKTMFKKCYLGDSVYLDFDGYGFTLTTENGYPTDPSNQIYLEPNVYRSLFEIIEQFLKPREQEDEQTKD